MTRPLLATALARAVNDTGLPNSVRDGPASGDLLLARLRS